jgi:hypothetical protein
MARRDSRRESAPRLAPRGRINLPTFLTALGLGTAGSAYIHHGPKVALLISATAVAVPVVSYVAEKLTQNKGSATRNGIKYGKFLSAIGLAALSAPNPESAVVIPPVLMTGAIGVKIATGALRESLFPRNNAPVFAEDGHPDLVDDDEARHTKRIEDPNSGDPTMNILGMVKDE